MTKFPNESELILLTDTTIYQNISSLESKITDLFGEISADLKSIVIDESKLPSEIILSNAKISRGNNYNGLPWTILDYPRKFSHDGVFAFRLLCLRGHSFILTLHLNGKYFDDYKTSILKNLTVLKNLGFSISNGKEEWKHLIDENFIQIPSEKQTILALENEINAGTFIKLARPIPFSDWMNLSSIVQEDFKSLLKIIY